MKKIAVTGSGGQLAYSLLFRLAHGDLFGESQPISLSLYDLPEMGPTLEGVAMELEDSAFPLLSKIKITSDLNEAFEDIDIAFLVGAKPRGPGMERGDLLKENGKIFVTQGRALNESASPAAKILVVGNPCNTNALIALHHAPKIPPTHFHAMMRLDQNRAVALLAKKAGVEVKKVENVIIWGNHSATQVPDASHAKIGGRNALDTIGDKSWLQEEWVEAVQKRGAAVINARGKSSAASAANAAIDAMRDLLYPTPAGHFFSSGIYAEGNPYGIEGNLVFGFPLHKKGAELEIVPKLAWDYFISEKIAVTQKELIQERECVASLLKKAAVR